MKFEPEIRHKTFVVVLIFTIIFALFLVPRPTNAASFGEPNTGKSALPEHIPRAVNRTAEIENILMNINEGLLAKYIQKLQDFKTRYSYRGDKCYPASGFIYEQFANNGLDTYYDEFTYSLYRMRNVIGEKPGTSTSNTVYIICAHYDSTAQTYGWTNAPGADDNGSGTAAVMAAAEILSDYEFNHTIRFIAFGGEEQGLLGSQNYANSVKAAGENISGVINLDMIAHNPAPGTPHVNLNTNDLSMELANRTKNISMKYQHLNYVEVDKNLLPMQNSDHASFWPEYPAFIIIEKNFNNDYYHKTTDTIDKLNMTYCANVTQIAVAAIAEMAELNSTDIESPVHSPGFPPPGGHGNATPIISIEVTDASPLNLSSIEMRVDGSPVVHGLEPIPLGYNVSFQSMALMVDGQVVNVSINVKDIYDNAVTYSWEFTVDATNPEPPTNLTITLSKVRTNKRGLAIDRGASGEDDDTHTLAPSIIYNGGEYKMWYTGHNGSRYHIMYANSTDGLTWLKHGVVLHNGAAEDNDSKYAMFPSVLFDGEYKMWYSGQNGSSHRIMYANSSDGLTWTKQGVVINIGNEGKSDSVHAGHPSVVKTDEYKIWYNGFDGKTYNIMYANSSDGLTWNKRQDPVTPQNPSNTYGDALMTYPEVAYHNGQYYLWYNRYDGSRHRVMNALSYNGIDWADHGLSVNNGLIGDYDYTGAMYCGSLIVNEEIKLWYSGRDSGGYWRIHYSNLTQADMVTDLRIGWAQSTSEDAQAYEVCRANTPQGLVPWQTLYCFRQNSFNEPLLGGSDTANYYYIVRSIDKVGHTAQCPIIIGKIGKGINGWGLMANPLLLNDTDLAHSLVTLNWDCVRTYRNGDPNPWKSNISGLPASLNTLDTLNQKQGFWAHTNGFDIYASLGEVRNLTIEMRSGWNLIAYPHHEERTVSDALSGLPWDRVEGFDTLSPYGLTVLGPDETMVPGNGYWIHLTADATWTAINL